MGQQDLIENLFNYLFDIARVIPIKAEHKQAKLWFLKELMSYKEQFFQSSEQLKIDNILRLINNNETILFVSFNELIFKLLKILDKTK